jgi:hypothetical protein
MRRIASIEGFCDRGRGQQLVGGTTPLAEFAYAAGVVDRAAELRVHVSRIRRSWSDDQRVWNWI